MYIFMYFIYFLLVLNDYKKNFMKKHDFDHVFVSLLMCVYCDPLWIWIWVSLAVHYREPHRQN